MRSFLLLLAATPQPASEQVQAQIIDVLNATGPSIDACVARYVAEQPSQAGVATVTATVDSEGRTRQVAVSTPLPQARTLRTCLERVGMQWRFPVPKMETGKLSFRMPVQRGAKFKMRKPGEPPPPPPEPGEPPPPDLVNLSSTHFLPTWGSGPASIDQE